MSLDTTANSAIKIAQRRLFVRFTLSIALCISLVMLTVGVVLFLQLDSEQKKIINVMGAEYQRILKAHESQKLIEIAAANPQQLINNKMMLVVQDGSKASSTRFVAGIKLPIRHQDYADINWEQHYWYHLFTKPPYFAMELKGDKNFWLYLALDEQLANRYQQWWWIGGGLTILSLFVMVMVWHLISTTLHPLYRLSQVIDQTQGWSIDSLDSLDFDENKKPSKGLEQLNYGINHLLHRLLITIESLESTVDAVAHDLRTPLSKITLSAEKALSNTNTTSSQLTYSLSDCAESAQQANQMLITLMKIHDENSGRLAIQKEKIVLSELIDEVIHYFQEVLQLKEITIDTSGVHPCDIVSDKGRLTQVLVNLLDNGVKYSHKGGEINIECQQINDTTTFAIRDQGIGIEPKHHELIFKRLYRVEKSRTTQGYGLGLAQVQTMINTLQGKIEVLSALNKGSCFRISLPNFLK